MARAQQTPDSTAASAIKTLTVKQYNAYAKGPSLADKALPATLNNYPAPDDILKLTKELKLTSYQIVKLKDISKYLQQKKIQTGQSVLRNEKKLDELFSTHKVDEGSITFYANRYGLFEGEYRTSVLMACYNTYKTLTSQQITLYGRLKSRP